MTIYFSKRKKDIMLFSKNDITNVLHFNLYLNKFIA